MTIDFHPSHYRYSRYRTDTSWTELERTGRIFYWPSDRMGIAMLILAACLLPVVINFIYRVGINFGVWG